MRYLLIASTLALLSGCSLSTGIRFGDDGSVSKPHVHGGVMVSGTRAGK